MRRLRVLFVTFIFFFLFICLFIIIFIHFFANRKIRKVLTGVLALMLVYLRFLDLYQDGKGVGK